MDVQNSNLGRYHTRFCVKSRSVLQGFYPFGNNAQSQCVGHSDHCAWDDAVIRITLDVMNQHTINFQLIHTKPFEITQWGVTGSKIVNRQFDPRFFKSLKHPHGTMGVMYQKGFGQFNDNKRCKIDVNSDNPKQGTDIIVIELTTREIDRNRKSLLKNFFAKCGICSKARSNTYSPNWEMSDVCSANGIKSPGMIIPRTGWFHRIKASAPTILLLFASNFWLIMKFEFTILQCLIEFRLQAQRGFSLLRHLQSVKSDMAFGFLWHGTLPHRHFSTKSLVHGHPEDKVLSRYSLEENSVSNESQRAHRIHLKTFRQRFRFCDILEIFEPLNELIPLRLWPKDRSNGYGMRDAATSTKIWSPTVCPIESLRFSEASRSRYKKVLPSSVNGVNVW